MKLNIHERLVLVNVVPEKGNFETMTAVDELRKMLYPTQDEAKEFEIKTLENTIQWNSKGSERIEIPITEFQLKILNDNLNKLSENDSLNFDQYLLFKRLKEGEVIEKEKPKQGKK